MRTCPCTIKPRKDERTHILAQPRCARINAQILARIPLHNQPRGCDPNPRTLPKGSTSQRPHHTKLSHKRGAALQQRTAQLQLSRNAIPAQTVPKIKLTNMMQAGRKKRVAGKSRRKGEIHTCKHATWMPSGHKTRPPHEIQYRPACMHAQPGTNRPRMTTVPSGFEQLCICFMHAYCVVRQCDGK
jgi:hypothetical protein